MIISLTVSLVLTLIIELSISWILGIRNRNNIIVVICVNICTNPVVVYIANCMLYFEIEVYNLIIMIMELLVVIVEYQMYKKYLTNYQKSPFILSIVNNAISYGLGVLINIIL